MNKEVKELERLMEEFDYEIELGGQTEKLDRAEPPFWDQESEMACCLTESGKCVAWADGPNEWVQIWHKDPR